MRAKSRLDRWQEELAITNHEMIWVLRWMENKRVEWGKRAEVAGKDEPAGIRAYAHRQSSSWRELRDASSEVFHRVNPSLEMVFGYQIIL